jgi:hypothetical protein
MLLFALFHRYFSWHSPQAPLLSRQAATLTVDHPADTVVAHRSEVQASVEDSLAVASPQEAVVATRQADMEAAAVATHRVDSRADTEAVAEDTNKSQSATNPTKDRTSILSCCTRSRKFCSSKSNSEAAAAVVDTADTHQEDMEAFQANMEPQAQATDHQAPATVHPDTALDALSELNSDMLSLATKSLST